MAEGPEGALEFTRELALQAGGVVMRWFRGEYAVHDKDGQPVTIADQQSNALIVAALAERFPADGILAEETPSPTTAGSQRALLGVDPLDGTSDFVKGARASRS
jgi:3'(2'), 5'-bisphosphate nucleotidase